MTCCQPSALPEYDRLALAMFGLRADSAGLVTWCGVRWIGVPFPLRFAAIARAMVHAREWLPVRKALAKFSGCGCLYRIKSLFRFVSDRGMAENRIPADTKPR